MVRNHTGNALKPLSWPHPSILKTTTSNGESLGALRASLSLGSPPAFLLNLRVTKLQLWSTGSGPCTVTATASLGFLCYQNLHAGNHKTSSILQCGYHCGSASGTRTGQLKHPLGMCLASKRTSGVLAEQEVCVTR